MPPHEHNRLRATILIPAYNEEAVIARGLKRILEGANPGEFEIIVVCNACHDRTAAVAAATAPCARIIETDQPGKTNAVNLADAAASAPVRIYLDADLEVDADALRALIRPLEAGEALASCGRMRLDLSGCNLAVRAFYRVWILNPYLACGKFGGLFALSPEGRQRIHPLPNITADDEFVRRSFAVGERAIVEECEFTIRAPRTVHDLLKIRRRSLRGARDLDDRGIAATESTGVRSGASILGRLSRRPDLWAQAVIYYAISIWVRLTLAIENPANTPRWERDESSRVAASGS